MDGYVTQEPKSNPRFNHGPERTLAERLDLDQMPPTRGRFTREDERPRTESYGELYQRASIYMRRN